MYKHESLDDEHKQYQNYTYSENLLPLKLNESWAGRRLVEALSQLPASNFSSSLDMKFQKKQLLEREQKKLSLTGGDISQASKTTIGNGKVRQMFDDRRRGVGIDRSHPLRPIATPTISTSLTTRTLTQQPSTNKRPVGGTNVSRRPVITNNTLMQSTTSSTHTSVKTMTNGNSNVFNNNLDELDNIDNETFPKEFSSLSLKNTHVMGTHIAGDRDFDNNSNEENDLLGSTIVISKRTSPTTNGIKLNPVITKKSPNTTATKPTSRTPSTSSRVSTLSKTTTSTIKSPLVKPTTPSSTTKNVKTAINKTSSTKPATFVLSVKPPPRISTPPPGMAACQHCQRNFNEDRLGKHEDVCRKMTTKKRKIFDASKHRVKGTEAEKYVKKGKVSNTSGPKIITAAIKKTQEPTNSGEKKSNWRKKHEEFIAAIREAKKVQAYLAKGGKLSDLPPPPPSENPDYIQCPHCSRRFNQAAAERHIPKCANMQHNKPKPVRKRI